MPTTERAGATQPHLRRYLLRWTLGPLVVVWLLLIAVAFSTGIREARKFADAQLVSVGQLWLQSTPVLTQHKPLPFQPGVEREYLQDMAVLAWTNGRLITDTHQMVRGLSSDQLPRHGLATVSYQSPDGVGEWRAFGADVVDGGTRRHVVVLIDMKKRYELGADLAEHVSTPAVLVLPLVACVLWWAIRRGLRPLDRLSNEVASLDTLANQRLNTQHRFQEFTSTVRAINGLVDSLESQAQRERQFASDVAHELRTPLAAIALQAQAAQHDANAERLRGLERDALRAGRILSQLLDLARVQRGGHATATAPPTAVPLNERLAQWVSDHAQAAHELGQDLSLVQPEAPVALAVEPLLLELALRNLVDNALRHTPAGTQVCVALEPTPAGVCLSVCDDGQRTPASHPPAAQPMPSDGLGLGLRLVERLAQQMGAELEQGGAQAPMTTRFGLRWHAPQPLSPAA